VKAEHFRRACDTFALMIYCICRWSVQENVLERYTAGELYGATGSGKFVMDKLDMLLKKKTVPVPKQNNFGTTDRHFAPDPILQKLYQSGLRRHFLTVPPSILQ
jgi:hypothetical protein